ncbi:MAG: VWA domain-containing protein [Acetobacteraceae bacterium]|nr:VWA domain-containing protein [Acetobacteraceae bacterium]
MQGPLLDFLRAARSAGLRISPAESIDAVRAVEVVGFTERETLRDTLSLVLAKTVEEKRQFEECFDRFFRRDSFRTEGAAGPGTAPAVPDIVLPAGEAGSGGGGTLARMLLEGDQAGLAAAMEQAAAEVGLSNIALFTQVNLFTRRILERMGVQELEREIAQSGDAPAATRLRQGREWLREQVKDFVQQHLQLFAEGENERYRERRLQQTRLAAISHRDHDRMRVLVRDMARRLATQYGRNRKRDRRGQLDTRRTLRRNMGWGGTPFLTVWKQQRIEKPKLVVLCDVSGSVAALAQFLLLFLYSLKEALSGLRAFAFAGELIEVSDILEREPVEKAIPQIMDRIGFGSSNYGNSLADFERGWMHILDSRTTVIILGDGRGNRTDPRVDILKRMADRSKQIIWLNPEYRTIWGTGDSDMLRYAPHCRVTAVCNTLKHLERVIGDLFRGG